MKKYPLLIYFGIFQIGHLLSNAIGAYLLFAHNQIGFPALPPAGGWPSQIAQILISMAVIDSINACAALWFVWQTWRGETRYAWLGTMTLSFFLYAALLFNVITYFGGGWVSGNLASYLLINVGYLPILIFYIQWLRKSATTMR